MTRKKSEGERKGYVCVCMLIRERREDRVVANAKYKVNKIAGCGLE